MTKKINILFLTFLLTLIGLVQAQQQLHVIQLQHRPAEEIRPLIVPLLNTDETIISNGFQLIVKTDESRIQEIKRLLEQLDVAQQNLIITVVHSRHLNEQQLNTGVSLYHSSKPLSETENTKIKGHADIQLKHKEAQTSQQIRVLDGQSAYIQTGAIQALNTPSSNKYHIKEPIYAQTGTGFEVIPRLSGQQITLEIKPWNNQIRHNQYIATQGMQSTITTQLGTWVELGGVAQQAQQNRQSMHFKQNHYQRDQLKTFIKIDKF